MAVTIRGLDRLALPVRQMAAARRAEMIGREEMTIITAEASRRSGRNRVIGKSVHPRHLKLQNLTADER